MRRSSIKRSKSRMSKKNRHLSLVGSFLIALAILGIGTIFFFNFTLRSTAATDPDSLCPTSGPSMIFAVLVDTTDTLSQHHQNIVIGRLREQIFSLPEGALIVLNLVTAESDKNKKTVFYSCKPKSGENANSLHENPRLIQERFLNGFFKPLEESLKFIVSTNKSSSSPIMESIQSLVVQAFPYTDRKDRSELIIISDLIQNSDAFSFYRGQDWDVFRKSQAFSRLSRNLTGVDVTLYQLPRPGAIKLRDEKVVDFWANYFDVQGAQSVRREIMGDL